VLPHCPRCARPCCALTDVVLDLSPREASALYGITKKSALPASLRRQRGRFYAHGAPCPAFDLVTHRCGVYDTDAKPVGCTDFPLYRDGDEVVADLRCEAVRDNAAALEDALVQALPDDHELVVMQDAEHKDLFIRFAAAPRVQP